MSMSCLLRITNVVKNEAAKSVSVVQKIPNLTWRVVEQQRQLNGWQRRHTSCRSNRNFSRRRNQTKQQQQLVAFRNTGRRIKNSAILNENLGKRFFHCTQRLSDTTTDEQQDKNDTNKIPLQMPDKDTELQLADLQATITEEYKRGNFKRALSSSQDLLKQTQQHFGYNVDHPATASAMNNVGLMHKLLGNFTEARQHYVGAMRIYASVCGRDHASYAMTLHNLGNLNKSQVHFDVSLKATERLALVEASMEYLEEAYEIRVSELGAEHPHTIATRSAIGSTLAAQVLYQHKMVEDSSTQNSGGDDGSARNVKRKRYVALDPEGITQQQWKAAEEHLRASLQIAIENPRGKQIQNNQNVRNHQKGKKKKKKQYMNDNSNHGPSSDLYVSTLSAASAAQNLAVFLKSLAMTFEEGSNSRKQHMYEAKDLYEKVKEARTQLLSEDHPDLYATKYSLAELLEVMASSLPSGDDNENDEGEQERQCHQKAADILRQEIIDTYDPPDYLLEEEEKESENSIGSEKKAEALNVVVEKTEGSKK